MHKHSEDDLTSMKKDLMVKEEKLKEIWSDRLIGCPHEYAIWNKLIYVRRLLFKKMEYFDFFYEYCEICIEQNQIRGC